MAISNNAFMVISVCWIVICIAGNIFILFYETSSPERPKMKDVGEEKCPGDKCCKDATCDGANCKPVIGTFCKNNEMCDTEHFCYHSICKAKPGTSCSKNEDCQSDALCTSQGKCKIRSTHHCTRDKHCESDICENEMCKYRSGEDCSPDTCEKKSYCEDGVCKNKPGSECERTSQCVTNTECEDNVCKIQLGQACSRYNRKFCAENAVCEFPFGKCRKTVNMTCEREEDCVSYTDCTGRHCKIPYGVICAHDGECQDNLACSNYRCRKLARQECRSIDECATNHVCTGQQCRIRWGKRCQQDRQCVHNAKCARTKCSSSNCDNGVYDVVCREPEWCSETRACMCEVGYYSNDITGICQKSCEKDRLTRTFITYIGYYISGHNLQCLENENISRCKQHCLSFTAARTCDCKYVNYGNGNNLSQCCPQTVAKFDVDIARFKDASINSHELQRRCGR